MLPTWLRRRLSAKQRLQWFPPFRAMSVKVLSLSNGWRQTRLLLPLNAFNQNPGGGMYGGAVANLADPIPALVCNRVFPGHQVWTRSLQLDFRREGRSDLELRFDLDPEQERVIAAQLQQKGRASPVFEFGFYDQDDHLCVKVTNKVAIRPANFKPKTK